MPSASFTCRAHFAVRETLAMRVHGSVSPTKQRQPRLGGDGPRNRNLSKYSMLHFHLIPTDHLTAYLLTLCRPPRLYAAAAALLSVSLSPPPPLRPPCNPLSLPERLLLPLHPLATHQCATTRPHGCVGACNATFPPSPSSSLGFRWRSWATRASVISLGCPFVYY